MGEISREESIKKMRLMKYCEIELPLMEHIAICEQAISDMEKLEKIEQIVTEWNFNWDNGIEVSSYVQMEKIEQIVKGAEYGSK